MSLLIDPERPSTPGWRQRWFDVVFGHQSGPGHAFDVALIVAIVASVGVAMADSVATLHDRHGRLFYLLEWGFTLLFTAEYLVRLAISRRPLRYARSFFGVVDLLAVLPTYLSLFIPGAQYLLVIRVLRILRVFRVLKLIRYIDESRLLVGAMQRSWRKILVFLVAILLIVTVFGAVMYLVEGAQNGYTSIPMAMYWAIVSVATVGYGDIVPATALGKLIASLLILIGYGIIAVPTGIYTAEIASSLRTERDSRRCQACDLVGHEADSRHCRRCGAPFGGTTSVPRAP
jgi:voltage-gated potassium channel